MRNQGTRNDVATRSAKPSNGKCSSATRGSSRKKQGRLFRFSPRSKTIEIAQPLTAIYFRSTPRSTCNALFSPIFERRNQASSAFLTPSSLRELRLFPKLSHPLPPSCHLSSHVVRTIPFYRVLGTLRHEPARRNVSWRDQRHTDIESIYARFSFNSEIVSEASRDVWKISAAILAERRKDFYISIICL